MSLSNTTSALSLSSIASTGAVIPHIPVASQYETQETSSDAPGFSFGGAQSSFGTQLSYNISKAAEHEVSPVNDEQILVADAQQIERADAENGVAVNPEQDKINRAQKHQEDVLQRQGKKEGKSGASVSGTYAKPREGAGNDAT